MNLSKNALRLAVVLTALLCVTGCTPSEDDFSTVIYKGHSYIIYDGSDFDSGIIHDPDCKH